MRCLLAIACLVIAAQCDSGSVLIPSNNVFGGFKPNCEARVGGGCKCSVVTGHEGAEIREFEDDIDCKVPIEMEVAENKKGLAKEIEEKFGEFKENCFPKPSGGCKCNEKNEKGEEVVNAYDDVAQCKTGASDPVHQAAAAAKKHVNQEIKEKFGGFKDNCFPKPSGGCKCNVDLGNGEEVKEFTEDRDCKKSVEQQTAEHKKELNQEIEDKFGGFKENCFPKPSGGCKCNEKDAAGNEVVATYNTAEECSASRVRREVVASSRQQQPAAVNAQSKPGMTRAQQVLADSEARYRARQGSVDLGRDQSKADPVRDRAQANYAAVVNELNQKFKGLKEGCFPRPKGCLCVTGKTPEGRDITERRMKDVDCKCQEGEKGPGCPAA